MNSKRSRSACPGLGAAASRRDFLRYGGGVAGASLLGAYWPRSAQAQSATTYDYYISTTGSDSNAGTLAAPWAITSLLAGNANQAKMAGKRVGVIAGTYEVMTLTGISSYPGSYSQAYLLVRGGSSAAPTVLASCNASGTYAPVGNSSGAWAVLDGQGTSSNNSQGQPLIGGIGSGYAYLTIDGFEIINAYYHPIAVGYETGGYSTISTRNAGISIQNNYIHTFTNSLGGANATGITLYATTGAVIQNNYITGISDTSNRATGIECWNTDNVMIQYNTLISTSNQQVGGIFIKNEGNYQNTVRFNHVDLTASGTSVSGSGGICIDLSGTSSNITSVYNNVVISDNPVFSYAISVDGWPNSVENQLWYNNTFVGIPGSSGVFFVRYGASATITHYNNIYAVHSVGFRGTFNTSGAGGGGTCALALSDYNCFQTVSLGLTANGTNNTPTLYTSLSTWTSALATATVGKDAHSLAANPLFVATGSGPLYYQLAVGSPCSGKGSTTGTSSGSTTDMGAWGNGATQIGSSFAPGGGSALPVPNSPTSLKVVS
ncbi:MAG TPA: right-handed parallel beta-helix repeat-containing protein [Steroidobacteraceae bacterium]|nr:right-handed parallel beta-helix repeat-containing protein [Steroidobacteraceae bacterium]